MTTSTSLRPMVNQLVVRKDLSGYESDIIKIKSNSLGEITGISKILKEKVVFNSTTRCWKAA